MQKWAREANQESLDDYLTRLLLTKTMGEIVKIAQTASNVRGMWGAGLVFNAVFDRDMGCIKQIAERIDGPVPDRKERDGFANILGDAIEDVLDYPAAEQTTVNQDDLGIIAVAKAVVYVSMMPVGNNVQLKKDRQSAVEMVLKRVGGKRMEPVKQLVMPEYVDPDWMPRLPE